MMRRIASLACLLPALCGATDLAGPNLGLLELLQSDGGATTVLYPTQAAEQPHSRGPFELSWSRDAEPSVGNGRLIVVSHGSGGSPWVHFDLARVLVQRGFVVAFPQHQGDNQEDTSSPGPESWVRRPLEVSRAIDSVAADARLASRLSLDAVGVFGGSAGGHTVLTLAGGVWSFSRFRDHCRAHIEQDFSSCVGFLTRLDGSWLDGLKIWLARRVIDGRFADETPRGYRDPRVQAAVAVVPYAADFDPASLAEPRIPLGLVRAGQDVNQVPRFHVDAVRAACLPRCTDIMVVQGAGHGVMLSPLPPLEAGSIRHQLLADPPDFDRARVLPELHGRVADFFVRHLRVPAR